MSLDENQSVEELLHGNLDQIVSTSTPASRDVACVRIGDASNGIYASATHPLAAVSVNPEQLANCLFAGVTSDGAADLPGQVAVWCASFEMARLVCESSTLLCVLPDVMVGSASLRLIRIGAAGSTPIHLMYRKPLTEPAGEPSAALAEALRRTLRERCIFSTVTL